MHENIWLNIAKCQRKACVCDSENSVDVWLLRSAMSECGRTTTGTSKGWERCNKWGWSRGWSRAIQPGWRILVHGVIIIIGRWECQWLSIPRDGHNKCPLTLAEQASLCWTSALWIILSCLASSQQPVQQQGRHLDILASPVTQFTLGLCLHSQECPIMSLSFPRLVTANSVLSKWPLYHRIKSTTSVMEPASLRILSMLCIRISLESFQVWSLQLFTYCQSMNSAVAPKSTREVRDLILWFPLPPSALGILDSPQRQQLWVV